MDNKNLIDEEYIEQISELAKKISDLLFENGHPYMSVDVTEEGFNIREVSLGHPITRDWD